MIFMKTINKNRKYITITALVAVIIGIFMPFADISAQPENINTGDNLSEQATSSNTSDTSSKTQIISVIPYVTRTENGAEQTVPIESREDMSLYPNSIYLRFQIHINATEAQKYYGSSIYIFKLKAYEEITDIAEAEPVASLNVTSSESFTYNHSVQSPGLANLKSGEIFYKFVVGAKDGEKYVPLSDAQYISNINCLSNKKEAPPVSKTKKGLSIQMMGEARMLGVGYTTVTMFLNDFMSAEAGANTEGYMYGNENYYFNIDKIAEYDKKIKHLTNEGINVTAVLLISAKGFTPSKHSTETEGETTEDSSQTQSLVGVNPVEYLIHPNALASAQTGNESLYYYGINTTNEKGVKYFEALMSFIADRYVKEDVGYGRIYNIILGSQAGGAALYNYCGKTDIIGYVKDYLRALRICDAAIRSRFGGSRVYVPFSNLFAAKEREGDFENKEVMDKLCEYSLREGNFNWNIAVQAFNADLYSPESWKETVPLNDFSTPVITMKNIEVLCNYINLEKKDSLPNGETRKIMLSDQGFSSRDNTKENQELQAAAFVYAYLKAKYTPDITAFIYHGHVDTEIEVEYWKQALGLWTHVAGTENEPKEPKVIYDVFKYMDTNRESEKIEFAKAIIGIEDFTEIVKLYSKDAEPAVTLRESSSVTLKSTPNATNIGLFNSAGLSGFIGTSNISHMSRVKYDNSDSEQFYGLNMLFAGISNSVKGDFAGIMKIYTDEEAVLNLKDDKYVGIKLRIDTAINMPEEQKIQLILIMEGEAIPQNAGSTSETGTVTVTSNSVQNSSSGAKKISVFEGIANISPNKDEIVYFDVSAWDERTNIKKIKVLVNPYVSNTGTQQTVSGAAAQISGTDTETDSENPENSSAVGKYDFNLYVYSIVSASMSKMSVIQTIVIILFVIVFIIVAGYGVLFIRARIIRKRRRQQRELKRQKMLAAARQNANRLLPPPRNQQNQQNPQNPQNRQGNNNYNNYNNYYGNNPNNQNNQNNQNNNNNKNNNNRY